MLNFGGISSDLDRLFCFQKLLKLFPRLIYNTMKKQLMLLFYIKKIVNENYNMLLSSKMNHEIR